MFATSASQLSPSSLYDLDAMLFNAITTDGEIRAPRITNQSIRVSTKKASRSSKQKVRHRDRQKLEKEALMKDLLSLQNQLQQERAKSNSESEPQPMASVWKENAKRHEESLLASQARRAWLRATIAGKNALIGDLLALVRERMKLDALITAPSSGIFHEPTDELLYAIDLHDINELYKRTDSVFSASGLDPTSAETTVFQRTVTKSADEVSIQYARRQHMLFNYEKTSESMWMLSHLVHRREDREEYSGIHDPANTIATKFRITKKLPGGGQLSLKERFTSRRFTGNDRTVLVWKATLVGEGVCSGMQTEETGWSVIRTTERGPGTLVEVCMRQVPAHFHSIAEPAAAKCFDNFLRGIIQENSQEITNGAKALLLESMLSGIVA